MTESYQGDYCLICLKTLDPDLRSISDLACGHSFHTSCIEQWELKMQQRQLPLSCPNCVKVPAPFQEPQPEPEQLTEPIPSSNAHLEQDALTQHNTSRYIRRPGQHVPECCLQNASICMLGWALLALGLQTLILTLFINNMKDIFDHPILSAGLNAKGFIAIGVFARGVISIGVLAEGLVTFSMLGSGLVVFVGMWGGTLGLGIYQCGISWYCYWSQLSLNVYKGKKMQLGVNLLGPLCRRDCPRFVVHQKLPDFLI